MFIVLGGELEQLEGPLHFRDCKTIEFVGAYPDYADAVLAWRAKAQQTVDNALARYFIIDADKLITPAA